MSQITVYDSTAAAETDLKVNVFDNDTFNAFLDGSMTSFVYDGITWTVSKTQSSGFTVVELTNNSTNESSLDLINNIFNYIDLGGNITAEDCVQEVFETPGQGIYRKDSGTTYPYIRYEYNEPLPGYGNYPISLNPSSGQSYGMSLGAGGGAFTYGKITTFEQGNLSLFGLVGIQCEPPTSQSKRTVITIARASGIASTNYVEVEKSAGDKGFRPITEVNHKNRGGGNKSGQHPTYTTDVLTQPGEPDESVASIGGSGFIQCYDITRGNLENVGKALYGETFLTFLAGLLINPLDFIIGLNIFPYTPHIGASVPVKIGRWVCTVSGSNGLGVNANGAVLTKQFRQIDFGTLTIAEMFESYLDYDASSFSLYLPFIGEVDIPVSEVMDGTINVKYTIDYFTGQCVANVLCTKRIALSNVNVAYQYSQHSYQGNCAVQIPVSHVSYGNLVGSLINAASAGLKGNAVGAAMSLATDVAGGGFKPTVQTKGTISANAGFCAILYPYITVTRPITAEPENFQEVMGYPSYMDATLATCQGLCVCDDINLSGLTGATDSEISRIKQMCKEGIYI